MVSFRGAARVLLAGLSIVACNALVGIEDPIVVQPKLAGCVLNTDCADSAQVCLFQTCSPPCEGDRDCDDGARCLVTEAGSACVVSTSAGCSETVECPLGSVCSGGACRNDCSGGCLADQQCGADGACHGSSAHDPSPSSGGSGGATGAPGMGGDGGAAGSSTPEPVCEPGKKRCAELVIETCIADEWTPTGDCPFACIDGACSGECAPQTKGCEGLVPRTCGDDAKWQAGAACAKVCEKGECVDRCTQGTLQCSGGDLTECGANGAFALKQDCAVDCVNEHCTECTPPAEECQNGQHRTCSQDGKWGTPFTCDFLCVGTDCGVCTPNPTPTDCINNTPQYCDQSGAWKSEGTACTGSKPVCLDGACVECTAPAKDCLDGNTPRSCTAAGAWKNATDCSGGAPVCLAGVCVACSPGTKGCADSNTPRSCMDNGTWLNGVDCSGAKPACSSGVCAECTGTQKTCINGDAYLCSSDSWSLLANCTPPGQICQSGVCAANNPYSIGFSTPLADSVSPADDILYLQKLPALTVAADLIVLGMVGRTANANAFARFVIYEDNAGAPGAYLARTGDVSIKAGSTEDVPIPLATSLSAGKAYWVGAVFTGGATTYGKANANATPIRRLGLTYGSAFPATFSGGTTLSGVEWNFYITVRDVSQ
jgi:hypothetical protein